MNESESQEQKPEKKLGFGSSPDELTFIFVGADDGDETGSCWYTRNFDTEKNTPIPSRAITGYITALVISKTVFKGKDNYKLNIRLRADRRYSIRAGVNTFFSRGFMLAFEKFLNEGNNPKEQPLTITVRPGEDPNIVFCSLFNAEDNSKIFVNWDKDRDMVAMINWCQEKLGQTPQTKDMVDNPENYKQSVHQSQPPLRNTQTEEEDKDAIAEAQANELFGKASENPPIPKSSKGRKATK